jgi:hypothetical protein
VATPWKNGGGITHEAMRVPPGGDPFLWRVSVAHIDASGPFSDFADYDRTMVLLRGAGIELRFGDGTSKTLLRPGDLVNFDGALATHGELLGGPCVDLNLMISKKDTAAARVERFIESFAVNTARNETTLVFPIDRRIKLQITSGKAATLEAGDLAVLSQGGAKIGRLESSGANLATSVFIATLKLVGGQ